MTDPTTVSFLASLSTIGNLILLALIVCVIVMVIRPKKTKPRTDKREHQ